MVPSAHGGVEGLLEELLTCHRAPEAGGPLAAVAFLRGGSWAANRPGGGVKAVLVGAWWLLREIELASLRRLDFGWCLGEGCGVMTLTLAVSKADTSAKGAKRTPACACPSALCSSGGGERSAESHGGPGA